jgi:two-component system invasion response regulator UvrY
MSVRTEVDAPPTIRILVVDDHPLVRSLICRLLQVESGFKLIGEAITGAEAILKAKELQPDVIILDMRLPDMDGLEVARMVKRIAPSAEVLVVSAFCGDPAEKVFFAGAPGYLLKADCGSELATAVRTVNDSKSYVSLALTA